MKKYVEIHNCIENNWIFNILGKPTVLGICKSGNEIIKQSTSEASFFSDHRILGHLLLPDKS